jgi:hypothetical protein
MLRASDRTGSGARPSDALRHCAPVDRKPPGRLISGIEMPRSARYGHAGPVPSAADGFLFTKVHLIR